jgi:hypothetical protein
VVLVVANGIGVIFTAIRPIALIRATTAAITSAEAALAVRVAVAAATATA